MHKSFLSPLNFELVIPNAEILCGLVQKVSLPDLNLGTATAPTPHIDYPIPGKLSYGQMIVYYKIDENLESYMEIYDWLAKMSHPDNYLQYDRRYVDARLKILNSNKRPNKYIKLTDCYPVNHSSLDFDVTQDTIQYMEGVVTFKFTQMSVHDESE